MRRGCIAAVVVLSAALAACSHETAEEVESETVVPVKVAPAVTGSIRATVSATGTVTPAPGAELLVIAPETARIAELPKGEGDRVQAGDLLVRFDIPSLGADLAARRAALARGRARVETARAAQTRARDLVERGVAARREVEDADRELAEAGADVAEATATLAAAEATSARGTIRATFDGVVIKRAHNPGDLVESSAADPILRVADLKRLEVTAAVPLADIIRVVPGASARIVDAIGDASVALKVVSGPIAVEPGTAFATVRLGFVAPTRLPVGAPVQVAIDAEQHRDVVIVPAAAVVHEGEETAVFVANGEKAERRAVTLGFEDKESVEIRSGLKAGEAVVVEGQAGLPDGAAILVSTPEPAK
jgi:RND family efflux transporter MFP subunit